MSNLSPAQELPNKAQLAANQSIIRGRVIEVKRSKEACYTSIALPAVDSYSHPQAVEIRSKAMIGRPQEDVTVRVNLGGFRRSYKDKMGEQQYATNVTLIAIED